MNFDFDLFLGDEKISAQYETKNLNVDKLENFPIIFGQIGECADGQINYVEIDTLVITNGQQFRKEIPITGPDQSSICQIAAGSELRVRILTSEAKISERNEQDMDDLSTFQKLFENAKAKEENSEE